MGVRARPYRPPYHNPLKLLGFALAAALIVLIEASIGLGHACLAGEAPQGYQFWLKDVGPFLGRVTQGRIAQFRLIQRDQLWRLELTETPQDVSRLALEEYQSLNFRDGDLNLMPLSDWIFNFDPSIFNNKKLAQIVEPKNSSISSFIQSWNLFRARFMDELHAFQEELKRRGYTRTAEVFFSKKVIQEGLQAALKDPEFEAKMKTALSEALGSKLSAYPVQISESFKDGLVQGLSGGSINARLEVTPILPLDQFKLEFVPPEQIIESPYQVSLGELRIALPLQRVDVSLKELSIASPQLKSGFQISPSDDVQMQIQFNSAKPLLIAAEVIWDKILQRPEIRISREKFSTPFSTAELAYISYRGKDFKKEQRTITDWTLKNAVFEILENSINDGHLLEDLMLASAAPVQDFLRTGTEIRMELVALEDREKETGIPLTVEPFQAGNPMHNPTLNNRVIAKFQFVLPLRVINPELDVSVDSQNDKVTGKLMVGIVNPVIEVENLQLFWRGERLQSDQMGFRVSLRNRRARETKVEAEAAVRMTEELQFELNPLKTNLEGLSVSGIEVRLGSRWLKGSQPNFQMIIENVDWIRSELVSSRSQNRLGGKMQAWIEAQVRSEANKILRDLRYPFDITQSQKFEKAGFENVGYIRTTGELVVDAIPIQDFDIRFRDLKKEMPKCQGTYLISAEAHLGISEPVNLVARPLTIEVGLGRYKSTIEAVSVMALTVPAENTYLDFIFDLCLTPSGETLDVSTRHIRHNLSKVLVQGVEIFGLTAKNETLPEMPEIPLPEDQDSSDKPGQGAIPLVIPSIRDLIEVGLALYASDGSTNRDVKISNFVAQVVRQNHVLLGNTIRERMTQFFEEKVPYYLNSPNVKAQLERAIIQIGGIDEQVGSMMFQLGAVIKQPMEDLISNTAAKFANELLPKANAWLKAQQNILDEMILRFGEIAGQDMEDVAYSKLVELIYGRQSYERLKVELERILKPNPSMQMLKKRLGIPVADSRLEEIRLSLAFHRILFAIKQCPVSDADEILNPVALVMEESQLSADRRQAVEALIRDVCLQDEDRGRELAQNILSQWFDRGISSANGAILNEAVQKYFKIPASQQIPLTTGPEAWGEGENNDRDFEMPVEIDKISLIDDVFRLSLYSKAFSNEWDGLSSQLSPTVREIFRSNDRTLLSRLPRGIINQALHKIEWAELIRRNFKLDLNDVKKRSVQICDPTDEIVVEQAPMIGSDDMIHFSIYMKCKRGKIRLIVTPIIQMLSKLFNPGVEEESLNQIKEEPSALTQLPGVNAEDVGRVLLSFLDLTNPLGFAVKTKGAIKVNFEVVPSQDGKRLIRAKAEPLQIDELKASPFLDQVILRRLEALHLVANQIMSNLFGKVAGVPAFSRLSNEVELERIFLDRGDFYIQASHRVK